MVQDAASSALLPSPFDPFIIDALRFVERQGDIPIAELARPMRGRISVAAGVCRCHRGIPAHEPIDHSGPMGTRFPSGCCSRPTVACGRLRRTPPLQNRTEQIMADAPTTGADLVIRALETAGVDTVFGIPGVHTLALYDALLRGNLAMYLPGTSRASASWLMDMPAQLARPESRSL